MKKIILAVLLLIPIIVILVINVSGVIISSAVALDVENIVITHAGVAAPSYELNLEDYEGKTFNLGVEYFPRVALETDIIWTSSDEEVAEVHNGRVLIKNYGSVDIVAMAETNNNAEAMCTLYIGGETLRDIRIRAFGDLGEGNIAVKRYERLQLEGIATPSGALGSNRIIWNSDSDTVSVDNNGVITAHSAGSAVITASATNEFGTVNNNITVIVSGEALVKQPIIYTDSVSVDIQSYITQSESTLSITGGTLSGTVVTPQPKATVTVSYGEEIAELIVERLSSEKLVIENLEALEAGMWAKGNFIASGSANVILNAKTALGSVKTIQWFSSDSSIIDVRNGQLFAGGTSGEVTITARAAESAEVSVTIRVLTPVTYFRLDQNAGYDKLGLARKKTIGSKTMTDGEIAEGVTLGIKSVYPDDASRLFEYKSSDISLATVDSDGKVIFTEDGIGKPVTITATPVFSTLSAIASYTFNAVRGVNIGMGLDNILDEENGILPSFQPYQEMHKVIDETDYAVVLHTDVYMPSVNSGGEAYINFGNSIYGNGHKLDGQFYSDSPKSRLLYWYLGEGEDAFSSDAEILIENLNVQAYKPTSDDSKEAFTSLIEKGGGPVCIEGARESGQTFDLSFKFCLFQYAYSHLDFTAGDIYIEGCIFRNNSATAITAQFCEKDSANVTVKNCIYSNTIAPIGVILGELQKILDFEKNYTLKAGTFAFEGNNYIYNWKKVDEIRMDMLPSVPDPTFNALVYQVNNMLSDFLRSVFTLDVNSDILYYQNGGNYVNLGFLVLGLWYDANPQINPAEYDIEGLNIYMDEDEYWMKQMDIAGMPIVQNPLIRGFGILPENYAYIINQRNKTGVYSTIPGETYNIDANTYNRLHGIA